MTERAENPQGDQEFSEVEINDIKTLGQVLEQWHKSVNEEIYRGMYYKMAEISLRYFENTRRGQDEKRRTS